MEGEKLFLFHIKLFLTDKKLFKIENFIHNLILNFSPYKTKPN